MAASLQGLSHLDHQQPDRRSRDGPTFMKINAKLAKLAGVSSSPLERAFLAEWKRQGGPELTAEFKFHPKRKWRFDYAVVRSLYESIVGTAIELEGGTWMGKSRHTSGQGFENDCEKYNAATDLGWRVYRLTSRMINPENIKAIIASL